MDSFLNKSFKSRDLLLRILAMICLSCQSNEPSIKIINEVPDSGDLLSKEITLDSTILIPSKILIYSDLAIIFDYGKEALFKVHRLPDFTFLYSFGKLGEGPDEFPSISENSLQINGRDLAVVSGTELRKIRLERDRAVFVDNVELLMSNSSPVNRLLMINDSTYICDIFDAKPAGPEHQMVNLARAEEVATFGKYPEPLPEKNSNHGHLFRDFGKTTVVNPKDGRMAAFYFYQNQIKFYSPQGELLQEIKIKIPTNYVSEDETNMYRVEPFATEKHIYVMYLGKTKSEMKEQSESFLPHLEIWDWEGNILSRFNLDQFLTRFAVSDDFQKMYGLSFLKEDVLFEYDLKDVLISSPVKDKSKKRLSAVKDKDFKKQRQRANPNSIIIAENDYYRMELPIGWNYTPSSLEDKNELGEVDGMFLNGAIFRSEKPEGRHFCGDASMWIKIAFPKEETFDFDSYLKSLADQYKSNTNLDSLRIKELNTENGSNGYKINFTNQPVDSKGNTYVMHVEGNIFEKENRVIRTSFSSCNLFEHYYGEVQESLATLTLKNSFP